MELNQTRSEAKGEGKGEGEENHVDVITISVKAENMEAEEGGKKYVKSDHPQLGQWLRAAVLGANDGLVTTASLMMGVGAVKTEAKIMAMSGLAALIAGACSMAIGEFVSVQAQRDSEISSMKMKMKTNKVNKKAATPTRRIEPEKKLESISANAVERVEALPNPLQAAAASACAFALGALVPLLSAAFIENFDVRVGVLAGVSSLALVTFGAVGAYFGQASVVKGGLRVLVGGWIATICSYDRPTHRRHFLFLSTIIKCFPKSLSVELLGY